MSDDQKSEVTSAAADDARERVALLEVAADEQAEAARQHEDARPARGARARFALALQ